MSENQFTKLFKYIEKFRGEVNEKFADDASQKSMNRLTDAIDG